MLFLWLWYDFKMKICIFLIHVHFNDFMHNVILSTYGCTNSMLLSIYIVVGTWGPFGNKDLDRRIIEVTYVFIWLKGINVFCASYWSIVIDEVCVHFWSMGGVTKVFSWLKFDEIETYYFLWFYMREFFKEYEYFEKSFKSTLLFIKYMRWMICMKLYKTFERSSTLFSIRDWP